MFWKTKRLRKTMIPNGNRPYSAQSLVLLNVVVVVVVERIASLRG